MLESHPPFGRADRDAERGDPPIDPTPIHLAYQACEAIARAHYENFPVASWFLAADRRRALAAIYAFARMADDAADAARPTAERLRRLDEIEIDLLQALDGAPPSPIFTALGDAIERHALPTEPFLDLIEAFRADARDATFDTWDDLLDYCRGSANTIGRLVLALHRVDHPRAPAESDAVCTALQLTNFWQDLGGDLERGRLFIPLEDLARFGVKREDLRDPSRRPIVTRLIEHECRGTEELFEAGGPIVGRVPVGLAIQLRATIAGGQAILRSVLRRGQDVITERPTLGTFARARIVATALLGFGG
ncbi:MAG TPA: squalene synthase HpnC [Candidatus Eisenbacteria bacterium]